MEIPIIELSDSLYQDFASREFPMSDLLNTYGPAFRFTAPGNELYDAKNIECLLNEIVLMDRFTLAKNRAVIRRYSYQVLKTADNARFYRMSNPKPVKKTTNIKSYVATGMKLHAHELDPSSISDIDELFKLVAKKAIIYIHNVGCQTNHHLDGDKFHNPATIRSPLALLKRKSISEEPGISDNWVFLGKRYTNSYFHTDDFGMPIINTMLNNGRKLWMVIDPMYNEKMIEKLRSISGLDNSCPYNYLDTNALIPASTLKKWNIKFYTCIQRQHETVVLGESIFHQCINLDFSVNIGSNFLNLSKCMVDTPYCQCPINAKHRHFDGVKIDGPQLLTLWRKQNS